MEIAGRFADLRASLGRPPQAHAVLRDLGELTGLSAYLARFVDGRIVIATVVEGPRSPHLDGAHATATDAFTARRRELTASLRTAAFDLAC